MCRVLPIGSKEVNSKIKCKGCGCMVWAGAKMTDGYCHDCYSRGKHLPPDDSDQWLAGSGQKKKSPTSTPSKPYLPPVRINKRRIIYTVLVILSVIAAVSILRGIGGGGSQSRSSSSAAARTGTAKNTDTVNETAAAVPAVPPEPEQETEVNYCFVFEPSWWLYGTGWSSQQRVVLFNLVRDGEIVRSVVADLPENQSSVRLDDSVWEDIISRAIAELGDINYLLFRWCSVNIWTIDKGILPDIVWCNSIADIPYDEKFRIASIDRLNEIGSHFAGFSPSSRTIEEFRNVLKEHLKKLGIEDVITLE
jgi:hypothetical protein